MKKNVPNIARWIRSFTAKGIRPYCNWAKESLQYERLHFLNYGLFGRSINPLEPLE